MKCDGKCNGVNVDKARDGYEKLINTKIDISKMFLTYFCYIGIKIDFLTKQLSICVRLKYFVRQFFSEDNGN